MNPLNSQPIFNSDFRNQMLNTKESNLDIGIQNAKMLYNLAQGNPTALLKQYPEIQQVINMTKGKDLKSIFMNKCKQEGIDPNVVLSKLL